MALLLIVGCATQQQRAEKRDQMRVALAMALANKQLRIGIESMSTLRYGSKTVTPDFFLALRGDTLCSYLPYLGQSRQSSMMYPQTGLNFEKPVMNYSERRPKANLTRIELDAKTDEDTYHYVIELYDTGEAHIHVRSLHRDPISFDGTVEL